MAWFVTLTGGRHGLGSQAAMFLGVLLQVAVLGDMGPEIGAPSAGRPPAPSELEASCDSPARAP